MMLMMVSMDQMLGIVSIHPVIGSVNLDRMGLEHGMDILHRIQPKINVVVRNANKVLKTSHPMSPVKRDMKSELRYVRYTKLGRHIYHYMHTLFVC
jgi:hypothetical protein